ncbi:hypothetical protein [Occultella gossypii]|uniref:Phage protein, HK97 gp10 family n=1 Tax=Occultella gossypii TaxID=2800820 RepID=A0ABS7SDD3_9MICO|nr:hypothetical protein [Occultella gossypii]MBZ2197276.1 hypothetical protein [Occultella gossypii]
MPAEVRFEGGESLDALARVMRKVGDGKDIKKRLAAALREAGQPVTDDMRSTLASKLPKRGGASRALTSKKRLFAVRNRLTSAESQGAGIKIVSTEKKHDYASLEKGTLRHPIYPGRRPRRSWRWEEQKVPTKDLLADVIADHESDFLEAAADAMLQAAREIEQTLNREV